MLKFFFWITEKLPYKKDNSSKNTVGKKNILGLISRFIYLKPANVIGKKIEEALAFFKQK